MRSPTTEISEICAVQKIYAKISTCLTACYFGNSVVTVLSTLHPDCPQKSVEYVTKPGAIWHDSKCYNLSERVSGGLDKSSAWRELPWLYTKIQTFPISFTGRVVNQHLISVSLCKALQVLSGIIRQKKHRVTT